VSAHLSPGQATIAPTDPGWEITGDVIAGEVMGRAALRFATGEAYLPAFDLARGTVEFDVMASSLRTFIGFRFHAASAGRFEEFYLRPHKSGLPDALQYAPALAGGRSAWQLFHGPGATATADFEPGRWTAVKVIIDGARAALFIDGAATPQLVVPNLALERASGFIGFWGLDASASRGSGYPTAVSRLTVRPDVVDVDWPPLAGSESPPAGVITAWDVSPGFAPASSPVTELPASSDGWRPAGTGPDGLLMFDGATSWPAGAPRAAALARLRITSEAPHDVPFRFGFSDDASVFLNGRLLYSGVNGYSYNFPRRDGVITPDQSTVLLPLQTGENELIVVVSDAFGGWGLMGSLPDRAGLTLRPAGR